jgi:hypothetical protein
MLYSSAFLYGHGVETPANPGRELAESVTRSGETVLPGQLHERWGDTIILVYKRGITMHRQLIGFLVILWCSFPAMAKQSMVCFDNQAACNNDCIAKGDMKCIERCTADAQACSDAEEARKAASQQVQRNTEANTNTERSEDDRGGMLVGNNAGKKKVEHGPEQLEAIAVCWQNKNNKEHWRCDGPTQDTIMADESLDKQLGYAGCEKPRLTDGSRTIKGGYAIVYLCGWGLWTETDVAKKYGITVQRNKYQCSGSKYPKSHCRENFQLTD